MGSLGLPVGSLAGRPGPAVLFWGGGGLTPGGPTGNRLERLDEIRTDRYRVKCEIRRT